MFRTDVIKHLKASGAKKKKKTPVFLVIRLFSWPVLGDTCLVRCLFLADQHTPVSPALFLSFLITECHVFSPRLTSLAAFKTLLMGAQRTLTRIVFLPFSFMHANHFKTIERVCVCVLESPLKGARPAHGCHPRRSASPSRSSHACWVLKETWHWHY